MPLNTEDYLDQFDGYDSDFMDQNSKEFEWLIGRYLINFSYAEHLLNRLLAEIINERTDAVGYIIMAKMSMYDKIDLLERFIKLEKFHGLKRPMRIVPLISKLKHANTFRNNLAHANWSSMRPNGMTRVKTKIDRENGVWFRNTNLSANVIRSKLKELDRLIKGIDLIELYD